MKKKILIVTLFLLFIFSLMKLMCIIISGFGMYGGCSFRYFISKSYIDVLFLILSVLTIGAIFKYNSRKD